ncbi:MAG: hypothetical protein JNK99_00360 [Candidatus Accumulibacter sp.]|jgi:hypothetical protein|uniref:hypothetical protein n=1 Tax=Accumulibacter sp. TaxID=2053492 RepID=UPI001A61B642|nr:hypothetical protein [Accumulibacter sp.]MBL8393189.1 hypothetical protein [Accumulibacter sp.]
MKSRGILFLIAFVAIFTSLTGRLPTINDSNFSLVAVNATIVAGLPALLIWGIARLIEIFRSRTF